MGLPGVLNKLIPILRRADKNVAFRLYKLFEKYPEIDNFFIDFNGILYQAYNALSGISPENQALKDQFEKEMTKQIREEMIMDEALRIFEGLLNRYPIKENLYIAVDGSAPAAKMNQQRQRRWKYAKDFTEKNKPAFDTNAFTPGTAFMVKFHTRMEAWIHEKGDQYAKTIYYDSFYTPGEGEHKIMHFLRKYGKEGEKTELKAVSEGVSIVYGMDADLLMLSVVSPVQNILLMREDIKGDDQIIDISVVKQVIHTLFKKDRYDDDYQQSWNDFILLMFIFGTDFFPRIVSLQDTETVMEKLIAWRTQNKVLLSNLDGSFNVENLMQAFSILDEEGLLSERASRTFIFPDIYSDECSEIEEVSNELGEKRLFTRFFNYSEYRKKWYTNLFITTSTVNPKVSLRRPDGSPKEGHELVIMVHEVVKEYLTGFAWVYRYYTQGMHTISQTWLYPYTYAPLLKDFVKTKLVYKNLFRHFEDKQPVNPLIQLLAVLPPQSKGLVSSVNMRGFFDDPALEDFYRQNFMIQHLGMNEEWKGVPIIAPADVKRIEEIVNQRLKETEEWRKGKKDLDAKIERKLFSLEAMTDFNPRKPLRYPTGRTNYQHEQTMKKYEATLKHFEKQSKKSASSSRGRGRGSSRGRGRGSSTAYRGSSRGKIISPKKEVISYALSTYEPIASSYAPSTYEPTASSYAPSTYEPTASSYAPSTYEPTASSYVPSTEIKSKRKSTEKKPKMEKPTSFLATPVINEKTSVPSSMGKGRGRKKKVVETNISLSSEKEKVPQTVELPIETKPKRGRGRAKAKSEVESVEKKTRGRGRGRGKSSKTVDLEEL